VSKGGWKTAAASGLVVLALANQANPGTAKKAATNVGDTLTPVVDETSDMVNNHLVPAASETVTAAKDGLASTDLLGGTSEPQTWQPTPAGG
jgi:hypothetical protein